LLLDIGRWRRNTIEHPQSRFRPFQFDFLFFQLWKSTIELKNHLKFSPVDVVFLPETANLRFHRARPSSSRRPIDFWFAIERRVTRRRLFHFPLAPAMSKQKQKKK
jgi:hypothetical protein